MNSQATANVIDSAWSAGSRPGNPSRIFIVEDEVIISEDISQTLQQLGYGIAGTSESGVHALLEVERTRPDLVLMDIQLAGRLDGIQTTAAIRKRWSIPVIYLTSHSDEATLARAKETGPHGYLLKPFNERDLRTAIEVALRKHELETKLEQRERWYATTLASVGDAVIATDAEERVTFMNPIAESLTGWRTEEAQGKPVHEVFKILSSKGDKVQAAVSQAIRGGFRAELPLGTKLMNADGSSLDVDDSIAPIVDREGSVLGSVLIFRDITDRKRLEQRVAAAERIASISTMAASMALELENPLAATLGNVDFALRRLAELGRDPTRGDSEVLATALEEITAALNDAQQAGKRLRHTVRDLKKFPRARELRKDIVDLPSIIDAALLLTQPLVKSSTNVSKVLGTTPYVEADEGQLVQVFVNLIANAVQAGGDRPGHAVTIRTSTDPLGRAVVEVRDTGRGIAAEDLPRIFDPFFSVRPASDALGLGLSICRRIVTDAGGEMNVESQVGFGATFRVILPEAAGTSQPPSSETFLR